MKFGVPWHVKGVGRRARETAREAARRSGMSVGEWLDTVIIDSASDESTAPQRTARNGGVPDDFGDEQIEGARPARRMPEERYPDHDEIVRPRYRNHAEHDDRQRSAAHVNYEAPVDQPSAADRMARVPPAVERRANLWNRRERSPGGTPGP